jgi:hypothetical protein
MELDDDQKEKLKEDPKSPNSKIYSRIKVITFSDSLKNKHSNVLEQVEHKVQDISN